MSVEKKEDNGDLSITAYNSNSIKLKLKIHDSHTPPTNSKMKSNESSLYESYKIYTNSFFL